MAFHDYIDLGTFLLSVLVVIIGATWAIPRAIDSAMDKANERIERVEREARDGRRDIHQKIEDTANSLDLKYNSIRNNIDDVKRDYARRDDLEGAVNRVERALGQMSESITSLQDRFDSGIAKFTETITSMALGVARGQRGQGVIGDD